MLIGRLLDRSLTCCPEATAATLSGRRRSFADLDREATLVQGNLRAMGVRHGDRVAWWSDTSLTSIAGLIACARIGTVFAPLNPGLSPVEADAALDSVRPAVLVHDSRHRDTGRILATGRSATAVSRDDLLDRGGPVDTERAQHLEPAETDPHIAYLTSGSTGRPKAVLVSHRASWLRSAPGGGTFASPIQGDGGIVSTFPLYHYGGWHYVLEALLNLAPIHLVEKADPELIIAAVEDWRASALYCIPAVWERILADEHADRDLSSLRQCDTGTSPVTGDLTARIKARVPGSATTILYGSTEAGRMAALSDWELAARPASVGRAAFPCSLWTDESGEVCVRSPAMMIGYLDDPVATAAVLLDGVYRSGDLGEIDADGYLTLRGRRGEVIRTAGEFVSPVEVERVLATHPGVADVAVIGIPDQHWGEVVCAVVVPMPDVQLNLSDVRAHVGKELATYKHPRRMHVVDEIPRTPATGQIRRAALRDAIQGAARSDMGA